MKSDPFTQKFGHARLTGKTPMSPQEWEWVLVEMDEMPGTMDPSYPEDKPNQKPKGK